jgi:hypothetical protein
MYRPFSLATALLAITIGGAHGQTTSSQTTTSTTVTPPAVTLIVPPPVGTLSTERTQQTISPDGTRTDSKSSTYRNTNGVANDSVTTTTTQAPITTETTTTKKSSSSN